MNVPHLVVKYNDKYFLKIGPILGFDTNNKDHYIYIKIKNIEYINKFIENLYSISNSSEDGGADSSLDTDDEVLTINHAYNHFGSLEAIYNVIVNDDNLVYGEDIFISTVLYNAFINSGLSLERYLIYSTDEVVIECYYLETLSNKNQITYDEEDLYSLYQTFCRLILENYSEEVDFTNIINVAYKKCLEYFANSQMDEGIENINVILNTVSFDYTDNSKYTYSNCKTCSNGNSASSTGTISGGFTEYSNLSCLDKYKEAMKMWLKKMLSDPNFYNEWMFEKMNDIKYLPNDELLDGLILLLEDFLKLDLDLSLSSSWVSHCNCKESLGINSTDSMANSTIIQNYINLLNWIKNCEIEENINKISLYGEMFGNILPQLNF